MSAPAAAVPTASGRFYDLALPGEWLANHPPSAQVRMTGTTAWVPSVTNVISNLDKPGLPWGAAGETAAWVISHLDETRALVASAASASEAGVNPCKACGRLTDRYLHDKGWFLHKECEEPWKVIRKQFQLRWNEKRDRGSNTHDFVERSILGQDIDPSEFGEAEGNARSWLRFVENHDPKFIMSEATVFNLRHGYAGTLDAIMDVGWGRFIIDVKTGPSLYFDHVIQLSAYRHAEGIYISPGVVHPMPEVDDAAVLLLGEDRYQFIPVPKGLESVDERTSGMHDVFERGFLSLLTLARLKADMGE